MCLTLRLSLPCLGLAVFSGWKLKSRLLKNLPDFLMSRGLCSTGCTCHLPGPCRLPILFSLLHVPHKSFGYSGGWEAYIAIKVRKFSVDEEWAGEGDIKVRHCVQTVVRQEGEVCTPYYSGGCNNQQECSMHSRKTRGGISDIPTTQKNDEMFEVMDMIIAPICSSHKTNRYQSRRFYCFRE